MASRGLVPTPLLAGIPLKAWRDSGRPAACRSAECSRLAIVLPMGGCFQMGNGSLWGAGGSSGS
jgi:hypothetical protein